MNKKELRKVMQKNRKAIPLHIREEKSLLIAKNLLEHEVFDIQKNLNLKDKFVMVFLNFKTEVNTEPIIKRLWKMGIKTCIPKVNVKEKTMKAIEFKSCGEVHIGAYGIREPNLNSPEIDIHNIAISILPGLAFNKKMQRLGYGGGYYDKFLSQSKKDIKKIGICFSEQIIEEIPSEKHDVKLDYIVTDFEILG